MGTSAEGTAGLANAPIPAIVRKAIRKIVLLEFGVGSETDDQEGNYREVKNANVQLISYAVSVAESYYKVVRISAEIVAELRRDIPTTGELGSSTGMFHPNHATIAKFLPQMEQHLLAGLQAGAREVMNKYGDVGIYRARDNHTYTYTHTNLRTKMSYVLSKTRDLAWNP